MLKSYHGHRRWGDICHVIASIERRPGIHCRDLVVCLHGTSGDGNSRSRDLVEAIVILLKSWGMARFDRARGRISNVWLTDTSQLAEFAKDEYLVAARDGVEFSLNNLDEHREYQRQRKRAA